MKTNPKVLGYKIRRKSDGQYMKKGGLAFKNAFDPIGSVFSQRWHAVASLKMKLTKETMDLALEVEIVELIEGNSYSSAWILDQLSK